MTETLGAAATAEVIAGDPHREGDGEHPEACANCETALQGPYCHACGQRGHLHSRLRDLFHEALEGIIHFDGRLWRTLPLLALNPGRLSREWREGKRVRYVQPLHLFLFAIFLFFTLPMFTGQHLITLPDASRFEQGLAVQEQAMREAAADDTGEDLETANRTMDLTERIADSLRHRFERADYYGYKIESLAYKLSFLIAPVSILILALLMLFKRGFNFYDHGVVSLYGIGFAVFVFTLYNAWGWVIGRFGLAYSNSAQDLMLLGLQVHAIAHLKGAYALGWVGAILRGLLLSILTAIGFGVLLVGIVALGLFG